MNFSRRLERVRTEDGYSLIELLTVVTILGIVMAGLTTLLVQGSKAELDMNARFRAQTEARVALDRFRRDAHTACAATLLPNATSAWAVKFTYRSGGTCSAGTTFVTWCTKPTTSSSWYELWRVKGVLNNNNNCVWGTTPAARWAVSLTPVAATPTGTACNSPPQMCIFAAADQTTSSLATVHIHLPVNTRPRTGFELYELVDDIALRNSCRVTGACTT